VTHFQAVFRRLLPRLGYQSAVWAIAHRICRVAWKILHEGVDYIEKGRRAAAGHYASRQMSSTTTQEVRLRPAYRRYQPSNRIVEVIFDGVAH